MQSHLQSPLVAGFSTGFDLNQIARQVERGRGGPAGYECCVQHTGGHFNQGTEKWPPTCS